MMVRVLLILLCFFFVDQSFSIEASRWVKGQGWVNAGELQVGDQISRQGQGLSQVMSITEDIETHTTYNFEVQDYHTYFVGEQALWVHNMCDVTEGVEKTKLKRIHSDETLNSGSNKFALESQRKRSTDDIVDSLKPGSAEPLKVKSDGRVFDGNTRIKVLEERGVNVDNLPRTSVD